ncbi:MAG: methyltransferase domain-containing protein [Gemmatimonadota bacterium]|nr:methyltransferase domain-containing protein [Gemmatimonadota bacterium]
MNLDKLVDTWKREEEQLFSGWDFSWLDGRMFEEQAPWSYSSRAAELMRRCSSVIDLGTGGGERLLDLQEFWPEVAVATEEYAPNRKLATERLVPKGAKVVDVRLTDSDPVPFCEGEFDLVLNRHSAFNPNEIARILAPGGTFLTQQIHGLWAYDLLAAFDVKPQWPGSTLERYVAQLRTTGLTILNADEWSGRLAFADVGAVVYYLKAVPWLVPGFSVETHVEHLLRLQHRLDSGDELAFTARKFLIEAQKEGPN